VLDVGTGTGAWIATLTTCGTSRTFGVDFSQKMIAEAGRKHPEIGFGISDAGDLKSFGDREFDIVTASFVLHGMKKEARAKVLGEMKRVAKHFVVIQDFYQHSSPIITILEWLERSDYLYFKKHFVEEMADFFQKSKVLTTQNENGLYIGMK
jgi:ubiquinone/menaquinone biosynthesis C-methylase UbiE